MSDARVISARTYRARGVRRCDFCCQPISRGESYRLYRGFDPNRSKDGGKTWGAFVVDRRHERCTPEALSPTPKP